MTGTAVVFSGPTLSGYDASNALDAIYLDPVAQGDLYEALNKYKPDIIGIIDGYFETMPAVWHKEILYAMAQGVHVLGSASTGALRAAELQKFGMVGVGKIYESYHHGRIEDDDEVAVYHGPKEIGFPLLSEAMVNIRQTAMDAVEMKIIPHDFHEELIKTAKNLYYKSRNYHNIFHDLSKDKRWKNEIVRFKNWLPGGRRDLKREDAIGLLQRIKEMKKNPLEKKEVSYFFESTTSWIENIENVYR